MESAGLHQRLGLDVHRERGGAAVRGNGARGVGVMLKCKPIADRPSDDALEQTYREGLEDYKQRLLADDISECCFIRGILVGIGIAVGYRKVDVFLEMMKDMESDSEFETALREKRKSARSGGNRSGRR